MSFLGSWKSWNPPAAGCPPAGLPLSGPSARSCSMPLACFTRSWRDWLIPGGCSMTNLVYGAAIDAPPACASSIEAMPPHAQGGETTLELIELLLKDPGKVDQLNREPARQAGLFPRFLIIALASYLVYS